MSEKPPLWAVLGTLAAAPLFVGTVLGLVPWWIAGPVPRVSGARPLAWAGAALVLLCVPVLVDFCARFAREGHGTPAPFAPPRRLVVSGPFRAVRNPAYLAALGVLLGEALLLGSRAVLVYAGAMAVVFHLFVVLYEEPALRRKFGAEYDAFCREVPRWIPRLRRGGKSRSG
jgi:protein-S-isoprenylcysteine O-methyltransferase Ste14